MTNDEVEAKLAKLGLSGDKLTEAAEAMEAEVKARMDIFMKTSAVDNLAEFFNDLQDRGTRPGVIMGVAGTIALTIFLATVRSLGIQGEEQNEVLLGIWENLGEQLARVLKKEYTVG